MALLAPHRAERSCHISSSEYVDFVEQTSTSKGHEETGTGQCPDCFEIVEIIFLPIIIDD